MDHIRFDANGQLAFTKSVVIEKVEGALNPPNLSIAFSRNLSLRFRPQTSTYLF